MAEKSERGTANEPVQEIDPGGTRPTKPGKGTPQSRKTEQPVRTSDQNERPSNPDRF